MAYDFDLFTIGAGSGGVRASRVAAGLGARVAIAEADRLGGTCVNVGCVPKKLMVYASELGHAFGDAAGFGWSVPSPPRFSWPDFLAAKDREIHRLNQVYGRLLHGAGCELLRGRARLVDAHTVEVEGEGGVTRHTADKILVATGGRPTRPTEPGTERAWVSDDVFSMRELPARMLVVGGGYIAVELACVFAGLGSKVTLAHRGALPLRGFDEDVRSFLVEQMRKAGVDVRLHTSIRCLEDGADGAICAVLPHAESLDVDAVLYAIGRSPNTEGLGLEALGVELDAQGAVVVDARYRTSVDNVYALGDVTNRLNLTPVAIEEGIVLAHHLFGEAGRAVDYDFVPTAVFSQPPLAAVGRTEHEVPGAHVYESEFRPLKHTLSGRDERSYMKLVVDPATDRVMGVHLVGADSAEIIQGFAVALRLGVTKAQLDATVGLHPTAAEELVTMRERRPDPAG
ncbi:MAG: glutathione-disulfide reductase [Sandaracinaceae bacterium]|nr:glutathione-disulfide reductase [Sandaracinaceae bacterium]